MDKNLHKGHRMRMKKRFIHSGLSGFESHNILELLLFYSIPMKDTNKLAHKLIACFGSLSSVFDASFEELIKVEGITENTATLIKLIPSISSSYLKDKQSIDVILNGTEKMGQYIAPFFIGSTNECVYMTCLDGKLKVIKTEKIFEGSVNAVAITTRRVVEIAAINHATAVVIAHNHPNGVAIPSQSDLNTTRKLKEALSLIDVDFLDHIIVADGDFVSLADSGML